MNSAARTQIKESVAAHSIMQTSHATLECVAEGAVWIRSPILPGTRQQKGFGQRGADIFN